MSRFRSNESRPLFRARINDLCLSFSNSQKRLRRQSAGTTLPCSFRGKGALKMFRMLGSWQIHMAPFRFTHCGGEKLPSASQYFLGSRCASWSSIGWFFASSVPAIPTFTPGSLPCGAWNRFALNATLGPSGCLPPHVSSRESGLISHPGGVSRLMFAYSGRPGDDSVAPP